MATRGTAIIITDESINFGPEFNGDMYAHGYGDEFMKKLSEVESNVDFIVFNNRFNKYNFEYDNIMSCYQGKYKHDELTNEKNILSMEKIYNIISSDYAFVKNISNKQIKMQVLDINNNEKNIIIKSGETIRVRFGIFEKNDRIKPSI